MWTNLLALEGPRAALAWVSLASVAIGIITVLIQAATKVPVRTGPSLMFRTAFILVFARIAYRLIAPGGSLTYAAVVIYAVPGIACAWVMIDAIQHGYFPQDPSSGDRTARASERTADATERMASQGDDAAARIGVEG